MKTGIMFRDPTAEATSALRQRTPPLASLHDKTVALMDIGKMRGDEFIDRLEVILAARGLSTRRYKKPTNTRTAPVALLQQITDEADVAIIALSDCGSCTSCSTHDLNDLDLRGVPGVSVLTEEFRDAFAGQCERIGFDGASVFVPHPMQNRTTAQLHELADLALDEILAALGVPAAA